MQFHAGRVVGFVVPIFRHAHVAGEYALHHAIHDDQVMSGKAGVDFYAQRLRLLAQPAADIRQAHNIVAVIAHQRRKQERGNANCKIAGEEIKLVLAHRGLDGCAPFLPVRDQFRKTGRIQYGARQNMRADFRTFFQHTDADFAAGARRALFQPDGRRQPRRTAAHDHNVIGHALAVGHAAQFQDSAPILAREHRPVAGAGLA